MHLAGLAQIFHRAQDILIPEEVNVFKKHLALLLENPVETQLARKDTSGLGGCLLKLGVMAGGSKLTNATASSFLLNPLNYWIHVQVHGRKITVFIFLYNFKSVLFIKAYCLSL